MLCIRVPVGQRLEHVMEVLKSPLGCRDVFQKQFPFIPDILHLCQALIMLILCSLKLAWHWAPTDPTHLSNKTFCWLQTFVVVTFIVNIKKTV